ncbi:hypothetical protein DdX_13750 [Ditylenchus destructor]|uniref:Uncharacterized protein n=1 Tax=Ditylenchus destructor TaxID=166010 RepID=A0AAD4MU16_9BILA|nr:hypothetical protein DdX_13750 [Ditylenchus destructor]
MQNNFATSFIEERHLPGATYLSHLLFALLPALDPFWQIITASDAKKREKTHLHKQTNATIVARKSFTTIQEIRLKPQ